MTQTQSSEAYKECWENINNTLRSTIQAVALEKALEPLRSAVTELTPTFESLKSTREGNLLDFDSNRRRLDALKKEKEMAVAKDKYVGDYQVNLDAKIDKYEFKKNTSGQAYDASNEAIKNLALGK